MLALAVSVDGFGVGFAYGVRRVLLPPLSLLIICLSSAFSVYLSMCVGMLASQFLRSGLNAILGGMLLIMVGLLIIRQSRQQGQEATTADESKGLAILPDVLREPLRADFDASGTISSGEAVVLGIALAMDAFGAGFSAALMGFTPLATCLAVGIIKFILISSGLQMGKKYAKKVSSETATVAAGIVLLALGIFRLCT